MPTSSLENPLLPVSRRERYRRWRRRLNRWLRLDVWFPHVPLALILGVLGFLQIWPYLDHLTGLSVFSPELSVIASDLAETSFRGLPKSLLGSILIIMALSLLTRSRMAWAATLMICFMMLTLEIIQAGPNSHPLLTGYVATVLLLLLLSFRTFNRISLAISTFFAIVTALLLLGYSVVGSYLLGSDFQPPIQNFVTALYFSVVTMTTVGYGDIIPRTNETRLFVVTIVILGVSFFATTLSTILVPLIHKRIQALLKPGGEKMDRQDHFVIVGDSALARNSLNELRARDLAITLILPHAPDEKSPLFHEDFVVGDATDLEVLRQAQAEKAEAILALSEDDSDNAFVVMAAKELQGKAKTVAVVNNAKNIRRMSRVNPDLIIAPEVLGAEILAMALGGETVDPVKILDRLLHVRLPKHPLNPETKEQST